MKYLVDTNVISEARKPRGHRQVLAWMDAVDTADLYLGVMVIGEIRRGAERLRRHDPAQAVVYESWLQSLKAEFADRILPISIDVTEAWARMNVPDPLPMIDSLLAATATVHDLTLVTRNVRDFERTGVRLLNPFEAHGP